MKSFLKLLKNFILRREEYLPSFGRKFHYFGKNIKIEYPSNISDRKFISIGSGTTILSDSRIQVFNKITENNAYLKIGEHCFIGYHFSCLTGENIYIGDNVLIASNVLITSENHGINPESDIPYMDQKLECKPVIIGDGTWLGEKVSVLSGVTIGKKCIIGTNSVVTKDIPDYSIACGIPCKVIKKYNFESHTWEKINEN